MKIGSRVIEMIEDLADIISKVVLSPVFVIAVFVKVRSLRVIDFDGFVNRKRECFITLDLIDEPDWHPIPAKLLGNNVLVEVQHRVNPVLP